MRLNNEYFNQSIKKYNDLEKKLHQEFPKHISQEIMGLVAFRCQEKFDPLMNEVTKRFVKLNEWYASFDEEQTQEEAKERLNTYYNLINPAWLANDLQRNLTFEEFRYDYRLFIDEMAKGHFGELFSRYQFEGDVFDFLINGLLKESDTVIDSLQKFSNGMTDHFNLMRDIQAGEKGKSFIRMAATGMGLAVGLPFMGLAAGALMNGHSEEKINRSFNNLEYFLDAYKTNLQDFLKNLEYRYQYVLLSLYGGTFLQMKKQFAMLDVELVAINLGTYAYELRMVEEDQQDVRKWAKEGFTEIANFLATNDLKQAAIIADRLFHTVNQNPLLKNVTMDSGKSLIYTANLYKFAVLSRQAMAIKTNNAEQFLYFTAELFRQLPYVVNPIDMRHLKSADTFELVSHFISTSISIEMDIRKKKELWDNLLQHLRHNLQRTEIYEGELLENESTDPLYILLIRYFTDYIDDKFKHKTDLSAEFVFLGNSITSNLANAYKQVVGKDKFHTYLKVGIVYHSATLPLIWLYRFVAKPKRVLLSGASLLVIISLFYFTSANGKEMTQDWKNKVLSLFDIELFETKSAPIEPDMMTLNVDMANMRNAPQLDSEVLDTAYRGNQFYILDQARDQDERIWYNVCPELAWEGTSCTGKTSWISAQVLE